MNCGGHLLGSPHASPKPMKKWTKSWALRLMMAVFAVICLNSCSLFGFKKRNDEPERPQIVSLGDYRLAPGGIVYVELFQGGISVLTADLTVDPEGDRVVPAGTGDPAVGS